MTGRDGAERVLQITSRPGLAPRGSQAEPVRIIRFKKRPLPPLGCKGLFQSTHQSGATLKPGALLSASRWGFCHVVLAAARAPPNREAVAQHFLQLAGFTVYTPRVREYRVSRGRKIEVRPPLFPSYLFVEIVVGWWQARWCPGTLGLVMSCGLPLRVPDNVVAEIKAREGNGMVELPSRQSFILAIGCERWHGPFADHIGLYAGMRPRERVEVLLAILGGSQRVTLPMDAVEAQPGPY